MRNISFDTQHTTTWRTPVRTVPRLVFRPITAADIPTINRLLQNGGTRACDYTIGGIYMWIDYFNYEFAIYRDTLFIKGVSELDGHSPAFSMPVGALSVTEAVDVLKEYCRREGAELRFSAIPEDKLDAFRLMQVKNVDELTDWADYIYDASSLASLSGKKLSKKRNHVNRFMQDNPEYRFETLTPANVAETIATYHEWADSADDGSATAAEERAQTADVLENMRKYPFEGAVLRDSSGKIVAFTLGEVIGDTLYVHIEKMDHDVAGAGETINKLFAEMMTGRHGVTYINREEDVGDPGLRKAKESYHPAMLLRKYDVTIAL